MVEKIEFSIAAEKFTDENNYVLWAFQFPLYLKVAGQNYLIS